MFQILIVEDDKEFSQLFQKVLEKNGYQVKSASDGAQELLRYWIRNILIRSFRYYSYDG